jgi:hypothetical protein
MTNRSCTTNFLRTNVSSFRLFRPLLTCILVIYKDLARLHRQKNKDEKKYVRTKRRKLRKTLRGLKGYNSETEQQKGYSEMESATPSPEGNKFGRGRGRAYVDDGMYEERRREVRETAVVRSGNNFSESIGSVHTIETTKKGVKPKMVQFVDSYFPL